MFARLNRAKRFAHCGDWSRSLAALEAGELAPPTPETVTALKAKHPPATEELPEWLSDFSPSEGDPCRPFLFALTQHLAIRPIQRQSPALFITSYADDTYVVGPTHDMFPAYTALTTCLNDLGLRVQPSKGSLWTPLDLPSDLTTPSDIIIAPNGLTVAGVPIGSDTHIISTVRDKLHSFSSSLPLLHELHDPQTVARLLTLCISANPSFLLRTVAPFPEVEELYTDWDKTLLDRFVRLIGSGYWPPAFDHTATAHR
ncbi:unnamed protein product [Closterium sp. NIES-53]